MLLEMDADANSGMDFPEFVRLINKIQSGNMAYIGTTLESRAPGEPNPPVVDPALLFAPAGPPPPTNYQPSFD
jgi:hypothetical protein